LSSLLCNIQNCDCSRLRSYSPALYTYCKHKIADKAFEVDEHMRAAGIRPEEAELEALLKLSVELGLEDKVYSLLHQLRATVREVSASTLGVVQQWFTSTAAVNAGKLNWSNLPQIDAVKEAVERGGGGWHGLGWLGKGPWEVNISQLDEEGVCQTCGEQLVTIDLDPRETEMFAESLFKLACQREAKNNEFRKFQAWLDQHGPFDAIVDAANVALHNQNFGDRGFNFYQLNAVVNGIQKKIGSNREPLILLHHQRTKGRAATASSAMSILKRWQNADCIYTTPTGSNDDWYWLYAAVRYKCVLVTNDEMRDHLFELLGNEFFPKWKERHQVRFTLNRKDPVFHMPPPYSIVIQVGSLSSINIVVCM
jgi:proteinaceous RNase P